MAKLVSGKEKTVLPGNVDDSRYEFLHPGQAEPNLGQAPVEGYILAYNSTLPGEREWVPSNAGAQGTAGSQGVQGIQGVRFSTFIGATPPVGPSAGDIWWDSETGVRYIWYTDADSSQWVQESAPGALGSQGVSGAGAQGIQGISGTAAAAGAQGIQGLTGSAAAAGAQGIQGLTGSAAAAGAQGIQGLTGSAGSGGTQGIQGISGTAAAAGAQGIQGLTGSAGSGGTQGIQGISGTGSTGATGSQGIQGLSGAVGSPGPEYLHHVTSGYTSSARVIVSSSTPPSSNTQGDIWFDISATEGYTQSLASTGWSKLPNGLIMQWGYTAVTSAANTTITFPTSFTTACFSFTFSDYNTTPNNTNDKSSHSVVSTPSTTSATVFVSNGTSVSHIYWIAIGY